MTKNEKFLTASFEGYVVLFFAFFVAYLFLLPEDLFMDVFLIKTCCRSEWNECFGLVKKFLRMKRHGERRMNLKINDVVVFERVFDE